MATILPAFELHPKEAEIVGRLLAGYGELEFDLLHAVGETIDDLDCALMVMFRTRGESQRIEVADALARHRMKAGKFRTVFEEAIASMKFCVQVRNQYAHCTWLDADTDGLTFTNVEEAAKSHKSWAEKMLPTRVASVALLQAQEAYFKYCQDCLGYVSYEAQRLAGHTPSHTCSAPSKMSRPPLHN